MERHRRDERSTDRRPHHGSSNSGSGASFASYLPSIFGRRPAPAPRTTYETVRAGERRGSADESASVRGRAPHPALHLEPRDSAASKKRDKSPVPFDPESVIGLIAHADPKDDSTVAEVSELVKAIAVYLVDSATTAEDDVFSPTSATSSKLLDPASAASPTAAAGDAHHALGIASADLQTLYIKAMAFSLPKYSRILRTAAKRLLAALIAIAPPDNAGRTRGIEMHLPANIHTETLYQSITRPSSDKGVSPSMDEIFVEVGALKALTRDGADVYQTEGVVGWLVRTIDDMAEEWVSWCAKRDEQGHDAESEQKQRSPFAPIKPASPSDALSAIIDLIASIVSHHIALFSIEDIDRILEPILRLLFRGVAAELTNSNRPSEPVLPPQSASRYETPHSSYPGSPASSIMPLSGLEGPLLRSLSIKRGRTGVSDLHTTPLSKGFPESMTSPTLQAVRSVRSPSPTPLPLSPRLKWPRPLPALCAFIEMLVRETTIPDATFAEIMTLLCLAMGQPVHELVMEAESAATGCLTTILEADIGRRAELAIRQILEGKTLADPKGRIKGAEMQRRLTVGAVWSAELLLKRMEASAGKAEMAGMCPLANVTGALAGALSSSRYSDPVDRIRWEPVDVAVLSVILHHVDHLAIAVATQSGGIGDAWSEGEAICEVLKAFLPTLTSVPNVDLHDLRSLLGSSSSAMGLHEVAEKGHRRSASGVSAAHALPVFVAILVRLPNALQHLQPSTSGSPPFLHPDYVALLLSLAPHLGPENADIVIHYYESEYLCLPFTTGWIDNLWKLLDGFCLSNARSSDSSRKVWRLLFSQVYHYTEDLPEHRTELVEKVIVPFLDKAMLDDPDEDFQKAAMEVLVSAAVAETMERDEEKRRSRDEKAKKGAMDELRQEDAAVNPTEEIRSAAAGGSFHAIRALIIRVASQTLCREEGQMPGQPPLPTHYAGGPGSGFASAEQSPFRRDPRSREPSSGNAGAFKSLVSQLSPTSKSIALPAISSVSSPAPSTHPEELSMPSVPPPAASAPPALVQAPPMPVAAHHDCRSLQAIVALIAIFSRLSFNAPHALSSSKRAARTPASARCLIVFRDLLGLLYPMTDDTPSRREESVGPRIPAKCPRARLAVLQWLMRLRADNKHRIYVRANLDDWVHPFAAMLCRTKETEAEALESEAGRKRSRPSQQVRGVPPIGAAMEDERGRTARMEKDPTRSRSRSKPVIREVDHTYRPLWGLPDTLPFETPEDEQPSEGLLTYDPNHPALRDPNGPAIEGVWLPVSEYVRVLNGILRGHDWELVSYVLCYLPLQLRNKTFFHGSRAVREVRALLDVLCKGVMGAGGDRWERRYNVPSFIKRVEINSTAYHSLSILISYRGVFTREECELLVQAFAYGLEGRKELGKPCVQALTLCIYEMEATVSRHLSDILNRMVAIVTTPALAVHILEFIIALGQSGTIFRNFTDEQYRRVFHVAIDYITIHNERSDQPVDLSKSREDYTLSQHVIGMAYYSIYIWFMALKLPQRPGLVPEITRKLLQGRSQRSGIDEMAEVCFDWLARYTYGNADPKPATSFLSEVVMQGETDPPKETWLLGGGVMTITAHARSGWATIQTTRPTGTTAVVCKLENVPLLELGEANADMVSLPAFLMANRHELRDEPRSDLEDPTKLAATRSTAPEPDFNQASQHGYIWSGATPSQRRKDVVIDPSYLGIQLLSSYPNASLDTPRGRLVPKDDKIERILRGIHNTPVIDSLKIAVLYAGPGQFNETEILGNIDGSPLYLDFLSGLGRLIRLKGQVDVFVGGLNRDNDSDGEYAYAWWDDFSQVIFHTPTMMPNLGGYPNYENKKRLVGNDYVKIVWNESGKPFEFNTIRTAFNCVNIVVQPLTLGDADFLHDALYASSLQVHSGSGDPSAPGGGGAAGGGGAGSGASPWTDWDRQEWFKVEVQRCPGIPDFTPLGEAKLVSRRALPILVRQMAHLANDMAARFVHIRNATNAEDAEYITSWRSRLRAIARLRAALPPIELPPDNDATAREELLRDFTRGFSHRVTEKKD